MTLSTFYTIIIWEYYIVIGYLGCLVWFYIVDVLFNVAREPTELECSMTRLKQSVERIEKIMKDRRKE